MEGEEAPTAAPPSCERPFSLWEEGSGDENALVIHSQVEEEEQHKCLVCGETFPQPLSLLRHQKQQHAGERAFVCPECGRGFGLKHNLIIHQRIHTGEKPFACGICGKRFSLKQNLLTHQRVHGGGVERPFACPACGKGFREERLLLAHQKGACGGRGGSRSPDVPEKPSRGRPCPSGERGEAVGQRPLRIKHQEKSHQNGGAAAFTCHECGEGFSGRSSLVSHQRAHRAKKPLPSEEGKRCFGPKETPRSPSRRLRAGDAPFQCLTCGKSFSQKGNLAAHRRSHLGQEMLG
ncbi:zinc finger protein LOC728743 homolog [Anolis carolinensis]|uniref:zinc finger protein LOC728743 homolog n=1 Tax=Anolis carolinensis TaxID=28377 RepID=UPI002F2B879C